MPGGTVASGRSSKKRLTATDSRMRPAELEKASNASAPLGSASGSRRLCQECGLFKTCKTPFMPVTEPPGWSKGKRILFVGEAPGEHEDTVSGRQFTGPAGTLLRRLLKRGGFEDRDFTLANTARCRPPRNATPTMRQVRCCRPFLLRAIELLKPRRVVALGATAVRALTNDGSNGNVTSNRGRNLAVPGLQRKQTLALDSVSATFHPAAVLRGATHLEAEIERDIARANQERIKPPKDAQPTGAIIAVDTEFSPTKELLDLGVASTTAACVATTQAGKDAGRAQRVGGRGSASEDGDGEEGLGEWQDLEGFPPASEDAE